MNKLNILNLATTDVGGAGIASRNFNDLFNKNNYNSVLLVKESTAKNPDVILLSDQISKYSPNTIVNKIKAKIENKLDRARTGELDPKYCFYNFDERTKPVSAETILDNIPFKPDIIVLHWVTNFINTYTINKLAKITKAEIYWIMMDNAPLTGGCHYPWECIGFQLNCGDCPALLGPSKKDVAEKNLSIKKRFLPEQVKLIACSQFDFNKASKSSLFANNKILKLLIPIDEEKYNPGNKEVAKSNYGISSDTKIIFYGSIDLLDTRKGGDLFLSAIIDLQERLLGDNEDLSKYAILIAGKEASAYFREIKIPIKEVGFLDEDKLIQAYQAADVYVSSSLEDSGPLMINQSIMCGTPVVSFGIGVALDLVHNGKTGYQAELYNAKDLAKGIHVILSLAEEEKNAYRNQCRNLGLELMNANDYSQRIFNDL